MQNLAALLMQMERIESEVVASYGAEKQVGARRIRRRPRHGHGRYLVQHSFYPHRQGKTLEKTYDLGTLEALIVEAVNGAIKEARKILKTELGGVIGGQVPPEFANFFGRIEGNGH